MSPEDLQKILDQDLFVERSGRPLELISIIIEFADRNACAFAHTRVFEAVKELKEIKNNEV